MRQNILVIDDCDVTRQEYGNIFSSRYIACYAEKGIRGLRMVSSDIGLVFLDMEIPDINGLDVLAAIRQEHPSIPVIMTTSEGTEDKCLKAFRGGARDYIRKPFSKEKISQVIASFMNMLPGDNRRSLKSMATMQVGNSSTDVPEGAIKSIGRVTHYIEDNYDSSFSLKDACKLAHLNRSYFCNYFKRVTGHTFWQYLTEVKMRKAKELLGDKRFTVTEIAQMVGYSNSSAFCTAFKKSLSKSPTKFKQLCTL